MAAYCANKAEATAKILDIVPVNSTVGISGSMTLEALGVLKQLEARGTKVFNQNKPGISREESMQLRKDGVMAEYYLLSPNAISEKGELVFMSAYGNRIAGVSNAKNVLVISGMNKIAHDLSEALKRAREYATPLNCKRLNYNSACNQDGICRKEICLAPEYKRMCCQILVIEAESIPGRFNVILVGENLGF